MKVLTFGEIMLRLKAPGHERFFQSPMLEATFGGGEANVAISLANYGMDAEFLTVLPKNGVELFSELLCDRVGHIPVAAFAVRLAGHPKKEALAALYDFQIFHHKAVIEFHAGKAHEIFHRFDDPHAYIQLYRGGWCSARSFFLHGFLLSASGQHGPKSLNGSRRWILQGCPF